MQAFERFEERTIRTVARELGAEYISAEDAEDFGALLRPSLHQFMYDMDRKKSFQPIVQALLGHLLPDSVTLPSSEAIPRWYDVEYQSSETLAAWYEEFFHTSAPRISHRFDSHYEFLNSLLVPELFERITGLTPSQLQSFTVLDIGTGNAQLLTFLEQQGIPRRQLHGNDLSRRALEILKERGFAAYKGPTHTASIPVHTFDLAFLSYFIEYDVYQKATVAKALAAVKPGGTIVFEGWLPARRLPAYQWDQDPDALVTKGRNAAEDLRLIAEQLMHAGTALNNAVTIKRIVRDHRFVHTHGGVSRLPSYFIVASVAP